jgi:hypothetical protein
MLNASGIRTGDNPPFTLDDLYIQYKQYKPDVNGNCIVPQAVQQMYLNLAHACIKETRWHSSWSLAMGWFIAHFLTLYIQGMADPNGKEGAVLKAGQAQGLQTSVSVGDVSVSTDYSIIANSVNGWAQWKLTIYGQQLMQIGRLIGIGAMYVN